MALGNPMEVILQAYQQKEKNRQDMLQNIAGLGQGLGQGFNTIGQAIQEKKKKQLLDQIVQAMKTQGAPQQGPQMPPTQIPGGQPMAAGTGNVGQDVKIPSGPPASGMGGPAQDNTQLIQSLMMQYDPQEAIKERFKQMTQKPSSPWKVVSGMLSKSGKPVQQNEQTGEVREVGLDVQPTGRGNASFGTGSVTWETASDEDKNLAKALYEGRIRSFDLGYRDRSIGTKLANEYALKNKLPPFKSYAGDVASGTAKAFAFGKFGQNENSLNTALGHVNSAYDAYQAVGNTNQEWLNQPLNVLRSKTNDPNIVKLGLTLNALRGELATVFKGTGGTDQEISSWRDYLTENLTPDQINGAIPQIDELLRSRLKALEYQRQSGMSGRGEAPLLSPKGAEVSKRFGEKKQPSQSGWSYVGPAQ